MEDDRPLLVFDGRCGFCRRFIPRWKQLTGERVRYLAFVEDADQPIAGVAAGAYRQAVHLRLPGGIVHTGASAVAELGGYTGRLPVFRTLYRGVPPFRWAADLGYRVIAKKRVAANTLAETFVGPDLRRPRQVLVRWLFLRLLALTTLCAVFSWWAQVDGLVGDNGIQPAQDYLAQVTDVAKTEGWGALETFRQAPTLAWISASDGALHALCALAAFGALLLFFNLLPGIGLFIAWAGYLSLVTTGGVFMGYQWDALLLESLFVAFFVVPWRGLRPGLDAARAPSWAGVWLVRLLVFKLMFLSGVVKLLSDDPVWADKTALDFHYWSQPLPAPTSFFFHHLPAWFHDLSVHLMFTIELALPFLIFSGVRRLRYFAAYGFFFLMVMIGLTGNYGFFNLLSFVLALMLLDDGAVCAIVPRRWRARVPDSHDFAHRRPPLPWRLPVAILASYAALISAATFAYRIDPPSREAPPDDLAQLVRFVAPFHVAQSYGLFAVMTTERPEIALEGSRDGVAWRPYRFSWKPDALDEGPSFTGPHMPRLDWQMWFAALRGDCRRASWYLAFARRLLKGAPEVIDLLADNPFPEGPPRYLRSRLWHYTFATSKEHDATGAIWVREPGEAPFCPTLELRDGSLRRAAIN